MKIVFATNNLHKLEEIRDILGPTFNVVSLRAIGCHDDIPETGATLEENALQKAQYIYDRYHISCFADDTGLEVEALGGAPGVHTARYAEGTDHDSEANMAKLLRELNGKDNRRARFRTVITLITPSSPFTLSTPSTSLTPSTPSKSSRKGKKSANIVRFEGVVNGYIATEKHGTEGFGYDPIFIPEGFDHTFAELGEGIKNTISHRARAVRQLAQWLKTHRELFSLDNK